MVFVTSRAAYLAENGLAAACSAVEDLAVAAVAAIAAVAAVAAVVAVVAAAAVVEAEAEVGVETVVVAVGDLERAVAALLVDKAALNLVTEQLEVSTAVRPSAPGIDAMVEPY